VLLLWDATTGRLVTRQSTSDGFADLQFSPDGRRLAASSPESVGASKRVWLWDTATGQTVRQLQDVDRYRFVEPPASGATRVDRLLVVTSNGIATGSCRVWDGTTGAFRFSLPANCYLTDSPDPEISGNADALLIHYFNDAAYLVDVTAGAFDDTVRLWDLRRL
jgi:WD40 repeat protein